MRNYYRVEVLTGTGVAIQYAVAKDVEEVKAYIKRKYGEPLSVGFVMRLQE
jgi:hypothetical protein